MPHSSPSFTNTVIQHFPKLILHFLEKSLSGATMYRRLKKLEDGVSDAPSKSIEFVDELVEIIGQNPYCIWR